MECWSAVHPSPEPTSAGAAGGVPSKVSGRRMLRSLVFCEVCLIGYIIVVCIDD